MINNRFKITVMLTAWWNTARFIHYNFLKHETNHYCRNIMRWNCQNERKNTALLSQSGQQKRANHSNHSLWQYLSTGFTTDAPEVGGTLPWSFFSPSLFFGPFCYRLTLFQASYWFPARERVRKLNRYWKCVQRIYHLQDFIA